MSKHEYILKSLLRSFSPDASKCPNCGAAASKVVARKYGIFSLRRCSTCLLQFRTPVDPPGHGNEFYQEEYSEGLTTDMPDAATLARLKETSFAGTYSEYAHRIALLRALGVQPGARIFEFGCSWGYGSWQLAQAGYDTEAYELSRPRREYAQRELGVRTHDRFPIAGDAKFDVFFSAHVMEHVPSPERILRQALELVRPGGLIITIVPNGSEVARKSNPSAWLSTWGEVHPNMIDERFLEACFSNHPLSIISSDGNSGPDEEQEKVIKQLDQGGQSRGDLSRFELIAVAKRTDGKIPADEPAKGQRG